MDYLTKYYKNLCEQLQAKLTLLEAEVKKGKKLDPVGKEDGDVDNDGDKDRTDKYLLNRRKAIGRAMGKRTVKENVDISDTPMPGYTYVGQDPNLRTDEEAEETRRWYENAQGNDPAVNYGRRGQMYVDQSEVDEFGRPTGVSISQEALDANGNPIVDPTQAKGRRLPGSNMTNTLPGANNLKMTPQEAEAARIRQKEELQRRGLTPEEVFNPKPVKPNIADQVAEYLKNNPNKKPFGK